MTSNNLANTNTDAFKAIRLTAGLGGDGVTPNALEVLDVRQGALSSTGASLDVALEGEGYLIVGTAGGEQLFRGGSLTVSAVGVLADMNGNPVLGEEGPIPVGGGEVQIMEDGVVLSDGKRVGRLRLVNADATSLQRAGSNYFTATGPLTEPTGVRVRQGHLEAANADAVSSMVDMIRVQRAYQASINGLHAIDDVLSSASRLGRVR